MNLKKLFIIFLIFPPVYAYAELKPWQVIPSESHITFTATQNGAPVSGEFKHFDAEIIYDPTQLSVSHIKILIDLASVSSSYDQLAETLKTKDWFDITHFAQATFSSNEFVKLNDKTYQTKGSLSLNGKMLPLTLTYTQENYSDSNALIKGSAVIKRTDFNVGQGEWADTKIIKDDVNIDFVISAKR